MQCSGHDNKGVILRGVHFISCLKVAIMSLVVVLVKGGNIGGTINYGCCTLCFLNVFICLFTDHTETPFSDVLVHQTSFYI